MRLLLQPAMVIVAGVTVAAGSYSALAGSEPVSEVVGAVLGSESGEDADTVTDADTLDGDEAEGQGVDGDGALGAMENAEAIAAAFEVDAEEVMMLHEEGIGFGALVKLYQLAKATGVTVEGLLASMEADGDGYAFGMRFRELTEEQMALLDGIPQNLGQLKKALRVTSDGAQDGEEASSAGLEAAAANAGKGKSKGKH